MIKDISYFIIHPKIIELPISLSLGKSISLMGKIVLLYLGLIIFTSIVFLPILKLFDLIPDHRISLSSIPLSFKLIFFVPIYEELIFRLPLKFSKQNLFLSLAALQFLLCYHLISFNILIFISFLIASIPYLNLIPIFFYSKLESFWYKYFPFMYYGLALCFGLLHLTNFVNLKFEHFLLFPFLVVNQIFMALLLGYVRVNFQNGFIYSVLLHFSINLPFIWISHL